MRRPVEDGDEALQASVAEAWLGSHASPNTRAAYRIDLETFARWCANKGSIPIRADARALVAFQAAREAAGGSAATLRRRWSALSSFFEFVTDRDSTLTNPVRGLSRPRVLTGDPSPTQMLSAEDVARYRAVAAMLDPRLDALVALIVSDGLKVGEALALDVGDVSGRSPNVSIRLRRRGESIRVMLDPYSGRAVRRCVEGRQSGPLFTGNRTQSAGNPRRLTRFGADHLIRQLSEDDATRVTANSLRRFHITTHESSGANIESVRDRAGLADVRSVRRYLSRPDEAGGRRP
jgi:site-specific recombinase XerD